MTIPFSGLKGKTVMITGGTGSVGQAVVDALAASNVDTVVLSRDETKQHKMGSKEQYKRVRFIIGDVRDRKKLRSAMKDVDFVVHAAALKHVATGELFPEECIFTNIIGTANVLDMAEAAGVEKVVNISTDKAVEPTGAYGMTKALAEKLVNVRDGPTACVNLRFGNVLGSRGSVLPIFEEKIRADLPLPITDARMTRFLMPLDHAVRLVDRCFGHGKNGDLFVIQSAASTVDTLVKALEIHHGRKFKRHVIGARPGERMFEVLLTVEERRAAKTVKEDGIVFSHVPRQRRKGVTGRVVPFTSANAVRYGPKKTLELIRKTGIL